MCYNPALLVGICVLQIPLIWKCARLESSGPTGRSAGTRQPVPAGAPRKPARRRSGGFWTQVQPTCAYSSACVSNPVVKECGHMTKQHMQLDSAQSASAAVRPMFIPSPDRFSTSRLGLYATVAPGPFGARRAATLLRRPGGRLDRCRSEDAERCLGRSCQIPCQRERILLGGESRA